MTFPITGILDDFNRADEGPPPSASWDTFLVLTDGLAVSGNAVVTPGIEGGAVWLTPFSANCEAYVTVSHWGTSDTGLYLAIRVPDAENSWFGYWIGVDNNNNTITLGVEVDGYTDVLDTASFTRVDGQSFGIRAAGDNIIALVKEPAGSWAELFNVTDSNNPDAGYAVIFIGADDGTTTLDDFGGGTTDILVTVTDDVTGTDYIIPLTSISYIFISDFGGGIEGLGAPVKGVFDTGGVDGLDPYSEVITAPLFPIADTGTGEELLARILLDTGSGDDTSIAIEVGTLTIDDTATGLEVLTVDGPETSTPDDAATGGLGANHVLRLLYGNDKRNPIRTLDLAESAGGHIFLKSGGFAPGAGERNELWSGSSIRFDGQRKLAQSRQNSQLVITYDLYAGSMAGLSELQRKINQFLAEAKAYHTLMQGEKVWLEYRWSDNLSTLPTPKFGQLSYYYEVYSGNVPKWPDDLHTGALLSGNVEGVALELTCSPYSEGLTQGAGHAYGDVTMVTEGVRVKDSNTWLKWLYCVNSGMTINFTVTGWITAYWSSTSLVSIFTYRYNAANLVKIEYDGSKWIITKIYSGTTFTANSPADTVATGDDVHLALVQDDTTLRLYVNGTEAASVLATASLPDSGHIGLGCAIYDTKLFGTGSNVALDGWRIFADDLTATQVASLYAAELPIKTAGGQVGPPPFVLSTSASEYGSATDGLARLIGGVGGDVPAEADILIQRNVFSSSYLSFAWAGLKYVDDAVDLVDYLIFDDIDDGDQTGTSLTFKALEEDFTASLLRGRYRLLARIAIEDATVTITPKLSFDGLSGPSGVNYTTLSEVSFSGNGAYSGSYELADLGDLFINPPENLTTLEAVRLTLQVEASTSARVILDRLMLIPYPYNKVIPNTIKNSYYIPGGVAGRQVCLRKTMALGLIVENYFQNFTLFDGLAHVMEHDMQRLGPPLLLQPRKYNYFVWSDFTLAEFNSTTRTASVAVFVTPRYLLPGGMVA